MSIDGLQPIDLTINYRLGAIALSENRWQAALDHFDRVHPNSPDFLTACHDTGVALLRIGRPREALDRFETVLKRAGDSPGIRNNIGACWMGMNRPEQARHAFETAIGMDPGHSDAWFNLGRAAERNRDFDTAVTAYRRCLALAPDQNRALAQLVYAAQWACDWTIEALFSPRLDRATRQSLDTGAVPAESPFKNIVRCMDPALNLSVARAWSDAILRQCGPAGSGGHPAVSGLTGGPIVVGYLSADFHNHATAHLIQGLFRLHDRKQFRIHAYSYGPDDGSDYRRAIGEGCDRFVDIRALTDQEAADRIRTDGVGILVDLKGFTQHHRLGICARRPSPINVAYLGFPGSYGATFMDYIIADPIVMPPGAEAETQESVVRLPQCYQVNDHRQPIDPIPVTRHECRLPETGLVMCAFHQPYKIEPLIFNIWMMLLSELPGSVLWLVDDNAAAKFRLRRAAQASGIAPSRLVFAPRWPKARHLARHQLADLMLDTRRYNGHTTISDALWAGVPVVAVHGRHFASRVSLSLLTAAGLDDWCAPDLDGYRRQALALARDASLRNTIRVGLRENRSRLPLFDTPGFTRRLETAFRRMWRRWRDGLPPESMDIRMTGWGAIEKTDTDDRIP